MNIQNLGLGVLQPQMVVMDLLKLRLLHHRLILGHNNLILDHNFPSSQQISKEWEILENINKFLIRIKY